jgi:hypothetical protein
VITDFGAELPPITVPEPDCPFFGVRTDFFRLYPKGEDCRSKGDEQDGNGVVMFDTSASLNVRPGHAMCGVSSWHYPESSAVLINARSPRSCGRLPRLDVINVYQSSRGFQYSGYLHALSFKLRRFLRVV